MINPFNDKDVYIGPERQVPDTKDVYIHYILRFVFFYWMV